MLERAFQSKLIKELKETFKGCIVMKMDAGYKQGIPDLLILYRNKWAALEVKKSAKASLRPNQAFYISKMDNMSFARIIYPENKKEVLDGLSRLFKAKGTGTKTRTA
jgi:hypothetical protein